MHVGRNKDEIMYRTTFYICWINISDRPVNCSILWHFFPPFAGREEKKKKQKQEGCDTEEKTGTSSGGSATNQGSKGGGGTSQQPLKRGQKVGGVTLPSLTP